MAKREKKVFGCSSDVIHLFAQRTQSEGKSSNCFFYSDKIYSYGYHYLLGEFITNKKGELAIMINNNGYSVTTAKHISEITSGTRQYKQFFTQQTNEKSVIFQLEELSNKLPKARKKEYYVNSIISLINSFEEFINWNGEKITKYKEINKIKKQFSNLASSEEYIEAINKRQEKQKKNELKKLKESLQKFMNYEINSIPYNNTGKDFLRISSDKKYIETTQNIAVKIESAKMLFAKIKKGEDVKGFRIDNYTVISMNGELKIGCHHIDKKNVFEIGEKILAL
jgi:hypothetical protein